MRLLHFVSGLIITSTLVLTMSSQAQAPQKFPVVQLSAGMHLIQAEVARTESQRQQGLMFRDQMKSNEGMIFLFGQPAGICMWMKNTLIPLSVAFLDTTGTIINIEEMKEKTLDSHCATKPAAYALEMNAGWFKQHGIKPGMKIQGIPQ
jgi:uncharacterized membrane protein (UPF0127 family)